MQGNALKARSSAVFHPSGEFFWMDNSRLKYVFARTSLIERATESENKHLFVESCHEFLSPTDLSNQS